MAQTSDVIVRGGARGDLHLAVQESVRQLPENKDKLELFFSTFKPNVYQKQLEDICNMKRKILNVYMDDLEVYMGEYVFREICGNMLRYVEILYTASDTVLRDPDFRSKAQEKLIADEEQELDANEELTDEERMRKAHDLRSRRERKTFEVLRERGMRAAHVPAHLRCDYEIHVVPSEATTPVPVREGLRAENVGSYITMEADVVRAAPTHPRMRVAGYRCKLCGDLAYQPVTGNSFMPLLDCPRPNCKKVDSGSLHLFTKICRIVKNQDIRVQEPAHEVPQGDIPYMINCGVVGELSGSLIPGSTVTMSGVLKIVPKQGFAAMKGDRNETLFEVLHFQDAKESTADTKEEEERIEKDVSDLIAMDRLYDRLAFNIAPEIHGQEDVKKALLLQMLGGVTKTKHDGGHIRGDMHILLMGDPGVAKSQLMKRVCQIATRAVYATGMGSSGVGLTAAIIKDPVTNETTLEGGALVLADKGMCCIDEFDKMDEYDRSAIYEVMEQQSVSIAKAGHCNTLPARCAVLAAANPADGRYDVRKSVMANMNMPAALLTRFDLQFLLLDVPDKSKDSQMADHILNVIRGKTEDFRLYNSIDHKVYRAFLNKCRTLNPTIPVDLADEIAAYYAEVRQVEAQQEGTQVDERTSYTTLRTVLAILRICQALAKLRFSETVEQEDFYEARRLCTASKCSVTGKETKRKVDPSTQIFELIRRLWKRGVAQRGSHKFEGLPIAEIERQAVIQGFKKRTLDHIIELYVESTVLCWNEAKTHLLITDVDSDTSDDDY